jgi:DNA-binding PadR family transcriptional regulator
MTSDLLGWWWGMKLSEELDLRSGTVYPLLARLERAGWLESVWENIDPSEEGRPRRRLYRLTGQGEQMAFKSLAEIGQMLPASTRVSSPGIEGSPRVQWT